MMKICRFCLLEDEEYLIPVADASELAIDIEEVALFSGIRIDDDNKTAYAMCLECTNKLQICSTFRKTCMSNDTQFRELRAMVEASASEPTETVVELSDSSEVTFDFDGFGDHCLQSTPSEPVCSRSNITELLPGPDHKQSEPVLPVTSAIIEAIANDEAFAYSANYIEQGETVHVEDVIHRSFVDWNNSLNPIPPRVQYVRERGKRKKHLCEICGVIVFHMPSHYEKHREPSFECSLCPVKTKHKATMAQHIEQVHLKLVKKKCKICGKGFIHHKTYRYHMLTHESKGEKFECPDCEKTFPNAVYLRDHFNRLHNAAKKPRNTGTERKVRRTRNRSRIADETSDTE